MFAIVNLLATFIADLFKSRPVRAFPWNTAPTYLVRDNEGAYGASLHASTSGDGDLRAANITKIPLAESIC